MKLYYFQDYFDELFQTLGYESFSDFLVNCVPLYDIDFRKKLKQRVKRRFKKRKSKKRS